MLVALWDEIVQADNGELLIGFALEKVRDDRIRREPENACREPSHQHIRVTPNNNDNARQ